MVPPSTSSQETSEEDSPKGARSNPAEQATKTPPSRTGTVLRRSPLAWWLKIRYSKRWGLVGKGEQRSRGCL